MTFESESSSFQQMRAPAQATEVDLPTLAGVPDPLLFDRGDATKLEGRLLGALERLPHGGVLVIRFGLTRVSSDAARTLLARLIRRVAGGELAGRHVVLSEIDRSRYNLVAMLRTEGLTAVERVSGEAGGARLIGRVDPAVRETYEFMLTRGETTARDVKQRFGLETTSAATNRLTNLAKLALVRRLEERTVGGGGREYVYSAVI